MKFTTPATTNPIDRMKVVGKPFDRIDGPLKTTGTAPYAYEHHAAVPDAAYGYVVAAGIAKGRIASIDLAAAEGAPGVLAIVTARNAGTLGLGNFNTARLLGGPEIQHHHQALAVVVAESFEQARAAARLGDVARTLGIPKQNVRLISPYIGGGFGGKLFVRADAILAALGARAAGRPVKLALTRPQIFNNTTHCPATIQCIRIGAGRDGRITAIGHESWSGNLPGGKPENAVQQTELLYAGAHRLTGVRLAELDLPEGNAMRAPGEAPGLMALEIAMDEMAEKLKLDPLHFRVINDIKVDPAKRERRYSQRQLVECLRTGAEHFGWSARQAKPGQVRDGRWLVGMGLAVAFRNNMVMKSGARVRLSRDGVVTVETDMTDIGTGSYTIIAQTAAEMMGVDIGQVVVRLGDSDFPVSAGSGGQWGANSATAGVYAACVKLRRTGPVRRRRGDSERGLQRHRVRVRDYPVTLDKLLATLPVAT